jgi:hypothetical protein
MGAKLTELNEQHDRDFESLLAIRQRIAVEGETDELLRAEARLDNNLAQLALEIAELDDAESRTLFGGRPVLDDAAPAVATAEPGRAAELET